MGGCFSKTSSRRGSLRPGKKDTLAVTLNLPRIGTNTVLRYEVRRKEFGEVIVQTVREFQEGQMNAGVTDTSLLCLGGIPDGSSHYLLDLSQLKSSPLQPPPVPLAYGRINLYRNSAFVIGALDVSNDPKNWDASPPIKFRLRGKRWKSLPLPPSPISLCGSLITSNSIYTFGGFIGNPEKAEMNTKVAVFRLNKKSWELLNLECPVRTALPVCTQGTEPGSILIIGGYDPFDRFPESKSVLLFQNGQFESKDSLPLIGKLRFNEAPVSISTTVYLLSEDETLFTYDTAENRWSFFDIAGSVVTHETERMSLTSPREADQFVYRFNRDMCQFGEFSLKKMTFRSLKPLSFRPFVKHPGLLINDFGGVMVAGGTRSISHTRQEDTDQVWILDPSSRLTIDFPQLPRPQSCLRLLQISGDIYAMCGVSMDTKGFVSCSQVFHEETTSWSSLPPMLYVTRFPGVSHYSGGIYCIAGESHTDTTVQFNLIQVFRIKTNAWEILRSEYPVGVRHLGVVSYEKGMMCFGGLFRNGKENTACYAFDGSVFCGRARMVVPANGKKSTYFQDSIVHSGPTIYAFSKTGLLHSYTIPTDQWRLMPL